jgi:hypothetical protein
VEGGGIWAELVDTAQAGNRRVDKGCVKLAPYSLALLRFGADRRVTPVDAEH